MVADGDGLLITNKPDSITVDHVNYDPQFELCLVRLVLFGLLASTVMSERLGTFNGG